MKQRVFVGSSVEHLDLAYEIQAALAHDADVTVWTQGVFELSQPSLESLLAVLERVDYGVFVFAPDDLVKMRGTKMMTARDNVVFELGLFIGRLGRERSVIVAPQGQVLHLPTDLIGTTPATYDAVRAKNELAASLGPACTAIRTLLTKQISGIVTRIESGFRLALSPSHCVDIVTGDIRAAKPDPQHGAVVLPSITMFDPKCLYHDRSALGAYFQKHFRSKIKNIEALIQAELKAGKGGAGRAVEEFPAGTVVYLDCPLKTKHRIIICGSSKQLEGAGIKADTLSLVASLRNVLRLAAHQRLAELWMPVMGTGLGGMDFSVALSMMLLQLDHGLLHEDFHSIQRVVIVVHDPEGKRESQIEKLAKAYPLLSRT
jgi:O-acetyl-ADP-ribose deacetylase (regulator of RNase III)